MSLIRARVILVLVLVMSAAAPAAISAPSAAGINALFSLFDVHRKAGHAAEALETLDRLNGVIPAGAERRAQLADGYAQMGQPSRAIRAWESLARSTADLPSDAQIRLARLYEAVGRKRDAFELWKELARTVDTPSRRSLVEDRLLALGDELKALDEFASQLRQELMHADADLRLGGLLVRIYIRLNDKASAVETVQQYHHWGVDGIDSLKAQADIFRRLGDRDSYATVTHALIGRDSAHANEHLRELILSEVERHDENGVTEVRDLLGQLSFRDSQGTTAQFAGGVLMLANLPEEAITAYRRATASDPAQGDNWLLLGQVLRKQRRTDEAVSLFQTLIERSAADAAFITGIDGLFNAAVPEEYEGLDRHAASLLEWARTRILERSVATGERPYFYTVLADLGSHLEGPQGSVAALAESLASSGERRAATLRELAAIGADSAERTEARQLIYGRRLVALDRELPPDVYIDLGKAFLQGGERYAAERVFEKAVEVSGRNDVRVSVAGAFEKAGLERQAAEQYSRVLVADGRDLEVLLHLAQLRERTGQRDAANDLYEAGLMVLLGQQPAQGGDASYDYRANYPNLLRGYLATWPSDASRAEKKLQSVDELLAAELKFVRSVSGPEVAAPWRSFTKLALVSRFARRVSLATRHHDLTGRWDRELLELFGPQKELVAQLGEELKAWNLFSITTGLPPYGDDLETPEALARRTAVMSGDRGDILSLARKWAANGEPVSAFRWAQGKLEPPDEVVLCRDVMAIIRRDTRLLEQLLQEHPGFLGTIERLAGERASSDETLMRVITDPRLATGMVDGRAERSAYLAERLSPADLLEWMKYLLASSPDPIRALSAALDLWRIALERPLAPELSAMLGARMEAALRRVHSPDAQSLDEITAGLMTPAAHAHNLVLSKQLNDLWRRQTSQSSDYCRPVQLLLAGDVEGAIAALAALDIEIAQRADLQEFGRTHQRTLRALHSAFLPRYAAQLEELLARTPIRLRYRLFYSPVALFRIIRERDPEPQEIVQFLRLALREIPDDEEFIVQLHNAYVGQEKAYAALGELRRLYASHPDNIVYRMALFHSWLNLENPLEAAKLNATGTHEKRRGASSIYAQLNLEDGPARWLMIPQSANAIPEEVNEVLEQRTRVADALKDGRAAASLALRAAWLRINLSNVNAESISDPFNPLELSYRTILELPVSQIDSRKLIDVIGLPSRELEDYLRALDPADLRVVYMLYGLLIEAYRREGRADDERQRLDRVVREGVADVHDYALWLTFMEKDGGVSPDTGQIFDRLLARTESLTPYALSSMARIETALGHTTSAERIYRTLIARTLYPLPSGTSFAESVGLREPPRFEGVLNARQMIGEIRRSLPPSRAQALTDALLRLLKPDVADSPLMHRYFEAFAASVSPNFDTNQALRMLNEEARSVGQDDSSDLSPFFTVYVQMLGGRPWLGPVAQSQAVVDLLPPGILESVAAVLSGPAECSGISAEMRVLIVSMIARRLHELGSDQALHSTMSYVAKQLVATDESSGMLIEQVLKVTDDIGRPLDVSALATLIRQGRLDVKRIPKVVTHVAEVEGVTQALALGERAAQYTHVPGLIEALIALERDSGNEAGLRYWEAAKRSDDAARVALGTASKEGATLN